MHRANKTTVAPSKLRGVNQIQREAEIFCDQTRLDKGLPRVLEHIGANSESLSDDHRAQLHEIAELMEAAGAGPIKALVKPGDFDLAVSPDHMFITLSVTAPIAGGRAVELSDVVEALRGRKISKGAHLPKIQQAVLAARDGEDVQDQVIVRGEPATPGRNATIEFSGRPAPDQPLRVIDPGTLTGSSKSGWMCMKGDTVAVYQPPVEGRCGFTAEGDELPPPELEDCTLAAGENIRRVEHDYVADIAGMLTYDGELLSIRPVLVFPRDLTRSTKPINFDGEVIVHGTVRDGVYIRATGDIQIDGNIEAATIESTGGDVSIGQGVVGRDAATIIADQSIRAGFAERAMLRAGDDIILETGAMLCHMVAGNAITMVNGKGQLVGGNALAGVQITVRQLGSPSELKTEVSVGFSKRALRLLARIDERRRETQQQLEQCTDLIDRTLRLVRDPSQLDKASLNTLAKLKQIRLVLDLRADCLQHRRETVTSFAAKDTTGKVEVYGEVMQGVTVQIGRAKMETEDITKRRQFTYDEQRGRIVAGPLK